MVQRKGKGDSEEIEMVFKRMDRDDDGGVMDEFVLVMERPVVFSSRSL